MVHAKAGRARRIVVISDFCDGDQPLGEDRSVAHYREDWHAGLRGPAPAERPVNPPPVLGGYLERLPLAAIRQGLCDAAEIWSFWAREGPPPAPEVDGAITRRAFRTQPRIKPSSSNDMLGHLAAFGPPEILCVWGLGVDESIMQACQQSIKVYNSIDAPALRVPPEVNRHFDLVLTGAEWQSRLVEARHPGMATAVMPIGPEFASPDTFYPLGLEKPYDVVYVAAAQPYKRHDILFDALAKLPRSICALCVCGYGELGDDLRARAAKLGICVDFVGPPGVGYAEVNRLMNLAKIGVVCGVDDGAPAILTEYMLAGLPVLANDALTCGLQYITPLTGRIANAERFHLGIVDMLANVGTFRPRHTAILHWGWQATASRFEALVKAARRTRSEAGCLASRVNLVTLPPGCPRIELDSVESRRRWR